MCKIEKVAFLCKIDGKFAFTDVDALRRVRNASTVLFYYFW